MDNTDLINRFSYHPPVNEETKEAHAAVRVRCMELAQWFNMLLPEGREKSLAVTSLEEVMFWANGAIARLGGPLVPADSIDRYGLPASME